MNKLLLFLLALTFNLKLVAQDWTPLNGPKGYTIYSYILSRTSNELFVLSETGEVLVSKDKGIHWLDLSDGIIYENEFFKTLTKFHETQDGRLFLLYAKRFYKYDASNKRWSIQNDSVNFTDYTTGPDGILYAGNSSKFYISNDDGNTFIEKANWSAPKLQFECMGSGRNFAKLDTRAALRTFQDDGSGMDSIRLPDGLCGKILFDTLSGYLMNFTSLALYKTKDKGVHWNFADSLRLSYLGNVLRKPNGDIYNLNSIIRFSQDGGESWKRDTSIKALKNYPAESIAGIENDNSLFIYRNGLNFQEPDKALFKFVLPIQHPQVDLFFTYADNTIICGSNYSNIFQKSKDNGLTWEPIFPKINLDYFLVDKQLDNKGNLYFIEGEFIEIFNFETGVFQTKAHPFDWNNYKGGFVSKTNKIVLFDGRSLYVSSDEANSWSQYPVRQALDLYTMQCSASDLLYYYKLDTIYYSFDFGKTWSYFLTKQDVFRIELVSKNNIFYWLERDGNILKFYSSPDFGKTQIEEPVLPNNWLFKIDEFDRHFYQSIKSDTFITIVGPGTVDYISADGLDYITREYGLLHVDNSYIYFIRPHKLPYRTTKKISKLTILDSKTSEISIMPNPLSETALIKLPESFNNLTKTWNIYSITGTLTYTYKNTENKLQLNANEFSEGIYFIQVITDSGDKICGRMVVVK
ncbi:MAG: T9SS type A sorting domain-containing protein [Saprospiraceae bacterium]|nr:T9SS type A sorting domain-containing protein [Saprospiraceae bacterium]MBK8296524.1 T9SS type A sorting domain-containing protein [Saprospiraceae bacterium]